MLITAYKRYQEPLLSLKVPCFRVRFNLLIRPFVKAMVLKSTKDLSLEIALTVSEAETIFTLSPYTVSLSVIIMLT